MDQLGGGEIYTISTSTDRVSIQENAILIDLILVEEVHNAICSMAEDKTPGLDGFPPLFF